MVLKEYFVYLNLPAIFGLRLLYLDKVHPYRCFTKLLLNSLIVEYGLHDEVGLLLVLIGKCANELPIPYPDLAILAGYQVCPCLYRKRSSHLINHNISHQRLFNTQHFASVRALCHKAIDCIVEVLQSLSP